jgi:hypothetical protein
MGDSQQRQRVQLVMLREKWNGGENMTPAEEKAFAGAFSNGALVVPTWARIFASFWNSFLCSSLNP